MGLSVEVGILSDLIENDPEGADHYRAEFENVNRFLATQSLPPHEEPESGEVWSCDMFGYSGLHYLRRIAAYLSIEGQLPPPGDEKAAKDSVLREFYDSFDGSRDRSFDHLIIHSDAEGYYLPQDFSTVLMPAETYQIAGGMIGSSPRLLAECRLIAEALALPLDLDCECEEVWEAAEAQGQGDVQWKRYGRESYTCLRLHTAAQHSIRSKAAVVFT